jgi:type IV pilus assembly protein PilN
MRVAINLATRPFVELRPLYARLRFGMGALALLAIALGIGIHSLSQRTRAAQDRMNALRSQTSVFQTERQSDERRMQQPANRAVLDRSLFLNALFQRKSFSWTAVMMDLERVLPPGVQVTSIEPVVSPEGDVTIRLRVSGNRDRAIELVRNLERSQRFLQPRLANESAQTQEGTRTVNVAQAVPGGVEFDILSGYNPLPESAAARPSAKSPGTASSKPAHAETAPAAASTSPTLRARPVPHPANPRLAAPHLAGPGGAR